MLSEKEGLSLIIKTIGRQLFAGTVRSIILSE